MSITWVDNKYINGQSTYSESETQLDTINRYYEEYKQNAASVTDVHAPVEYDGVYLGIINQISNGISLLVEKLKTVKEIADESSEIIQKYSKGEYTEDDAKSLFEKLKDKYQTKYLDSLSIGDALLDKLDYMNIYDDGYIPQGITIVGNQVFISAYTQGGYSRLYVYNLDGKCQYKVSLNTKAHVGGVTYDEANHVLLVTGENGAINAYSLDAMNIFAESIGKVKFTGRKISTPTIDLNNPDKSTIVLNSNININYDQLANGNTTTGYNSSTVYYDNETGKLYIARFSNDGKMITGDAVYNSTTGTYNLENPKTVDIDNGVQGINIYHRDGKTYLVESRSYGKGNDGEITVRDITNGIENSKVVGSERIHNYAEGTFTGTDGKSTVVYETGRADIADKNYNHQTGNIDIDKIIDKANGENWDIEKIDSAYDKGDASLSENGYNTYNI